MLSRWGVDAKSGFVAKRMFSNHQRRSSGGASAVGQLSAMIHPVHCTHEKDSSPGSEERFEAGGDIETRPIEIRFVQSADPSERVGVKCFEPVEKFGVAGITFTRRGGLRSAAKHGLPCLGRIGSAIHHGTELSLSEHQMSEHPVCMIARDGSGGNEGGSAEILKEGEHQCGALFIGEQEEIFRLHDEFSGSPK